MHQAFGAQLVVQMLAYLLITVDSINHRTVI